jgi:hypothetical protein
MSSVSVTKRGRVRCGAALAALLLVSACGQARGADGGGAAEDPTDLPTLVAPAAAPPAISAAAAAAAPCVNNPVANDNDPTTKQWLQEHILDGDPTTAALGYTDTVSPLCHLATLHAATFILAAPTASAATTYQHTQVGATQTFQYDGRLNATFGASVSALTGCELLVRVIFLGAQPQFPPTVSLAAVSAAFTSQPGVITASATRPPATCTG